MASAPQPTLRLDEATRNKVAEDKALGLTSTQIAVLHDLAPAPLKKLLREPDMKLREKAQIDRIRAGNQVAMIREQLLLPEAIERIQHSINDREDAEGLRTSKWLIERHLSPTASPAEQHHVHDIKVQADLEATGRLIKDIYELRNATPTEVRPLLSGDEALPRAAVEEPPK